MNGFVNVGGPALTDGVGVRVPPRQPTPVEGRRA